MNDILWIEAMNKKNIVEFEGDLPSHIAQLNARMQQIEQIAKTVEMVAEKGFLVAETYIEEKSKQDRFDLEFADKQHKRMILVLFGLFGMVFILIITAMFLKQFDLVKIILGSTLAVSGGAGITSLFKRK
jgi:hypothetical protein